MVKQMSKAKSKWLYYGLLFLVFLVLCYLFPYSHDDWAWGSSYGMERLETYFADYNGRWIGNFVVLALTRSNLLKTVSMSFSLVLLLFFINELVANKGKAICYLSVLFLLATPYLIFRQAVVWTAGFSNYVASMVFVFLFIYMNRELFYKEARDSWIRRIIFLLLGFLSTLFVEHVTIYALVLGIGSFIYHFLKYKKINLSLLFYFIGGIVGTILMFSNSAYSNISNGSDGYRSIGLGNMIGNSITSYFKEIYRYFFFENYVLNMGLSIFILINLYCYFKENKKYKKSIYAISFILVFIPIYALVLRFSGINLFLKYTKYINGIFSIFYYVSAFCSLFFIKSIERKRKLIFAFGSIAILTAPLFVVTPIGGRCFFPIYLFWIWIAIEFYINISKKENTYIIHILLACIFVFFLYLFCIYGYIFKVNKDRENYIRMHKTEEVLLLPKLPYAKYMWCPDPVNAEFMKRFKSFYNIDEEVEIKFITYKEWKQKKK